MRRIPWTTCLILSALLLLLEGPLTAQGQCRTLSNFSPGCLREDIDVEASCNFVARLYEDCVVGSPLFSVEDPESLTLDNCNGYFELNDEYVALAKEVDAELSDSLACSNFLSGGGYTDSFAVFEIQDVDEEPPVINLGPAYSLNVDENNDPDVALLTLEVNDPDRDETATLTVKTNFEEQEVDDLFELKTIGCNATCYYELHSKEPLDYETGMFYQLLLTFTSEDSRGNTNSSTCTVALFVQDMPDSPPFWTLIEFRADIDEDDEVAIRWVYQVEAKDRDIAINNDIKYSIVEGDEYGLFSINQETGNVSTTGPIDRDTLDTTSFSIVVQATEVDDAGEVVPEPNSVNQTTNVQIIDVNDNIPTFAPENVTILLEMPELTDKDSPILGTIFVTDLDEREDFGTYDLITSDPGHLAVSPTSGSQQTSFNIIALYDSGNNIFDFEGAGEIQQIFTITAIERNDHRHKSESSVTISITDVNDNGPLFTEAQYNGSIPEDAAPDTVVLTVQAYDLDGSEEYGNASIRYQTTDDCLNFVIDEMSGEVTVSDDEKLDYENDRVLTCTVDARDSTEGPGSKENTVLLQVTLTDINDETPELDLADSASVSEGEDPGHMVMVLQATDPDTTASVLFSLQYPEGTPLLVQGWLEVVNCTGGGEGEEAEDEDGLFCGELRVKGDLDRELMDELTVTVVVSDTEYDGEEQIATAPVTITITDVNDVVPEFSDKCPGAETGVDDITVMENSSEGTAITQFCAIDPDEDDQGEALVYSCSENDQFTINATSGVLTVKAGAVIDREAEDVLTVSVTVTDTADHNSKIEVHIAVLDQNDSPPELDVDTCGTVYTVSEDAANGTLITAINATDDDIGAHEELSYELNNFQFSSDTPFAIDRETGSITVYIDDDQILDREQRDTWTLNIKVYDNCEDLEAFCKINYDECEMVVSVGDVNDNAPELVAPTTVSAGERLQKDELVVGSEISGIDIDLENSPASEIHYRVLNWTKKPFGVPEPAPFLALDFNETNNFDVVEWSCRLQTTENLTHSTNVYDLTIEATDGTLDEPGLKSVLTITLVVTDDNDYAPVISMEDCLSDRHIIIEEEKYSGGDPIPCNDMSAGEPATMTYDDDDSTAPNNEANITIDYEQSDVFPSKPGQLYSFVILPDGAGSFGFYLTQETEGNISFEAAQAYNFSIKVEDNGQPEHMSSYDWVFLNVTPVSEFKPAFCVDLTACYAATYIKENTFDEGPFREAEDEDNAGPEKETIYYYLIGGDVQYFDIAVPTLPILTPTVEPDRETKEQYTVLVQATNKNFPPSAPGTGTAVNSTDMLQITVVIVDMNDNPPVFSSSVIYGSVQKTGSADQEAAYLYATDKDINETLTYSITGELVWDPTASYGDGVFEIENLDDTGIVMLKEEPSVLSGYCIFPVIVTDKKESGNQSDTATVQIFVVTSEQQVPFYFHNDIETLLENEENIADILTATFGYDSYIDSMTTAGGGVDNTTEDSVLAVHFVNTADAEMRLRQSQAPGSIVPPSIITSAATSGVVSSQLDDQLEALGIDLYQIGGTPVTEVDTMAKQLLMFQILLGVVGLVLGSLVFLLLFTYIIRTRKLERRLKVLSTNTFGSQASEINRTGVGAVPNSNLFRGEGANPIWDTSGGVYNDARQDAASMSSGDSVLVGVEDNPEFRDYREGPRSSEQKQRAGSANSSDYDDTPVAQEKPFVGAGGKKSNNPLFAGISAGNDDDSLSASSHDDAKSQEAGDLGIASTNFTFG